ncbi:hypothetical protein BREVNS_0150 [Brevinematales bacterium NS]|nr:hypothetical protein BREVNS_0150 [Brevinematales bacterium NS]
MSFLFKKNRIIDYEENFLYYFLFFYYFFEPFAQMGKGLKWENSFFAFFFFENRV